MSIHFWLATFAAVLDAVSAHGRQHSCNPEAGLYTSAMKPWDSLTSSQRAGAKTCGFTQISWDGTGGDRACFADLSDRLQQAALILGTDCECWDKAVSGKCHATKKSIKRPKHTSCEESRGLYNTSYVSWDKLSPLQQNAARKFDYDKAVWDGPVDCVACFEDLGVVKQEAVLSIGSDTKCFNRFIFSTYGINCKHLLRSTPDAKARKAIYSGVMQKSQLRPRLGLPMASGLLSVSAATSFTNLLFVIALAFSVFAVVQLRQSAIPTPCQSVLDGRPCASSVQDARYSHVPSDEEVAFSVHDEDPMVVE